MGPVVPLAVGVEPGGKEVEAEDGVNLLLVTVLEEVLV